MSNDIAQCCVCGTTAARGPATITWVRTYDNGGIRHAWPSYSDVCSACMNKVLDMPIPELRVFMSDLRQRVAVTQTLEGK